MELSATSSLETDASPHQLLQGRATFPDIQQRGRPWAGAWPCRGKRRLIPRTREWGIKLLLWNADAREALDWLCPFSLLHEEEKQHCSSGRVGQSGLTCSLGNLCLLQKSVSRWPGTWRWTQGLHADVKSGCKSTFFLCEWRARFFRGNSRSGLGRGGRQVRPLAQHSRLYFKCFSAFPPQPTAASVVGRDQCSQYFWLQSSLWLTHI